jgi:hypothetical protein
MFQGVDGADAEALASQFETLDIPRGTVIFHEGEPATACTSSSPAR